MKVVLHHTASTSRAPSHTPVKFVVFSSCLLDGVLGLQKGRHQVAPVKRHHFSFFGGESVLWSSLPRVVQLQCERGRPKLNHIWLDGQYLRVETSALVTIGRNKGVQPRRVEVDVREREVARGAGQACAGHTIQHQVQAPGVGRAIAVTRARANSMEVLNTSATAR